MLCWGHHSIRKVEKHCHLIFSQVVVPEAETRAGLILKPQTFPVTVTNRPVMDVAFVQFLASVSGKVSCLGEGSTANESWDNWTVRGDGSRCL